MAFVGYGIIDAFMGYGDESDPIDETGAVPDTETDPDLGETPDPDTGDSDPDYVSGPTTILTTTNGETSTTTFDDVDFGVAPTVLGTDERDQIDASDDTGLEINIEAGAGDDNISFGFGASVDGGEGVDVLALSVTGNALASNSDAGTIDLTDSDDALVVNFEDGTPEFVHAVRGQTITEVDGVTIQTKPTGSTTMFPTMRISARIIWMPIISLRQPTRHVFSARPLAKAPTISPPTSTKPQRCNLTAQLPSWSIQQTS